MNYFDSSALIKRFVEEAGSARVEALIAADPGLATSRVAYAEVHAGLARKVREGGLARASHRRAARAFDRDWPTYGRMELPNRLLERARDLVAEHPLRGFDAIHLASAIHLGSTIGEPVCFVAADARLLAAATVEGLDVLDVRA